MRYSSLKSSSNATFSSMLARFGVVKVMNAKVYNIDPDFAFSTHNADEIVEHYLAKEALCTLDTLKVANASQEGPTKTITGGQNADTLLKYGKTLTIEMQEALGRYDVLEHIYGVNYAPNHQIATFTDRFPAEITLVGTTFVIDQATGAKQPIHIVIPRFLGDGIFNLTQDAEGDATVFDLNGNVLKFEGGGTGDATYDTEETRFDHTEPAAHAWDGIIYGAGADNEFYFMCTKEIYETIAAEGYREAWENIGE